MKEQIYTQDEVNSLLATLEATLEDKAKEHNEEVEALKSEYNTFILGWGKI